MKKQEYREEDDPRFLCAHSSESGLRCDRHVFMPGWLCFDHRGETEIIEDDKSYERFENLLRVVVNSKKVNSGLHVERRRMKNP